MDLIERYFAADARRRTAGQPCETAATLRRLLLARIETRETALGRPLRADEANAELAGFAERLRAEARLVMRRLEEACQAAATTPSEILEGGSRGPR